MWLLLQGHKQPGADPPWHGVTIATPDFSQFLFYFYVWMFTEKAQNLDR